MVKKEKINIIIADDHEVFRTGLKLVLSQFEEFEVIGEAIDGLDLLSQLPDAKADIILLDICMPNMNGLECAEQILLKKTKTKIIILSNYDDEAYYTKLIAMGVNGFILKKVGINELKRAIITIHQGNNYYSQELLQKLILSNTKTQSNINEEKINLTLREQEILELIADGLSNQQIANKLYISACTVNNHRSNLLAKTKTNNTASLIMFAIKHKLLTIKA